MEMSQHVSTTWMALGAYKIQFVPKIIVTMLEMSLVKQKGELKDYIKMYVLALHRSYRIAD